ncbi:hypothetical protein KQI13_09780 [Anaerostipes hadrus]|jgi:hypothetical protein|nr:hypothetical protein [Anaerostipes hadrus]
MIDIIKVADEADLIVNGYAFTKSEEGYRVLNLNNPEHALVLSEDGEAVETTMDDIEIEIVKDYYKKNKKYMED